MVLVVSSWRIDRQTRFSTTSSCFMYLPTVCLWKEYDGRIAFQEYLAHLVLRVLTPKGFWNPIWPLVRTPFLKLDNANIDCDCDVNLGR